jgi:hypothetical protein
MGNFKKAKYPGFNPPSTEGKVLYRILGPIVYFSGITRRPSTSTESAAESIVETICNLEKIDWSKFVWRDIQTYHGYNDLMLNEYSVKQLELASGVHNRLFCVNWIPIDIIELKIIEPVVIYEHFFCLIAA